MKFPWLFSRLLLLCMIASSSVVQGQQRRRAPLDRTSSPSREEEVLLPERSKHRRVEQWGKPKLLTSGQRRRLESIIHTVPEDLHIVITYDPVPPPNAKAYVKHLFQRWSMGNLERNYYGILMLVSMEERRIEIEIGDGFVDADCIQEMLIAIVIPSFREGKFEEGLESGVVAIRKLLEEQKGSSRPTQWRRRKRVRQWTLLSVLGMTGYDVVTNNHPKYIGGDHDDDDDDSNSNHGTYHYPKTLVGNIRKRLDNHLKVILEKNKKEECNILRLGAQCSSTGDCSQIVQHVATLGQPLSATRGAAKNVSPTVNIIHPSSAYHYSTPSSTSCGEKPDAVSSAWASTQYPEEKHRPPLQEVGSDLLLDQEARSSPSSDRDKKDAHQEEPTNKPRSVLPPQPQKTTAAATSPMSSTQSSLPSKPAFVGHDNSKQASSVVSNVLKEHAWPKQAEKEIQKGDAETTAEMDSANSRVWSSGKGGGKM